MPHSVMMILGGFVLLALMVWAKKEERSNNALRFLPMWLAISIVNMLVGIYWAGYSWREELMVLLVIFGVPAAAALIVARLTRS